MVPLVGIDDRADQLDPPVQPRAAAVQDQVDRLVLLQLVELAAGHVDPRQQGIEVGHDQDRVARGQVLAHVDQPAGDPAAEGRASPWCRKVSRARPSSASALARSLRAAWNSSSVASSSCHHLFHAVEAGAQVGRGGLGLLQAEAVFVVVDLSSGAPAATSIAFFGQERLHHAGHPGQDLGFLFGFEGGGGPVVAGDGSADRAGSPPRGWPAGSGRWLHRGRAGRPWPWAVAAARGLILARNPHTRPPRIRRPPTAAPNSVQDLPRRSLNRVPGHLAQIPFGIIHGLRNNNDRAQPAGRVSYAHQSTKDSRNSLLIARPNTVR